MSLSVGSHRDWFRRTFFSDYSEGFIFVVPYISLLVTRLGCLLDGNVPVTSNGRSSSIHGFGRVFVERTLGSDHNHTIRTPPSKTPVLTRDRDELLLVSQTRVFHTESRPQTPSLRRWGTTEPSLTETSSPAKEMTCPTKTKGRGCYSTLEGLA